jgi:thiamine-phosphate pyrophosphorylase
MSHNKPIYALCDFELLEKFHFTLFSYLERLSFYNIVYIQYRDKINSFDIQKENIEFLKSHTNIPIIINDSLELLKSTDGLHLGQEDLDSLSRKLNLSRENTIKFIKKTNQNKIIGLSTHNEKEILEANSFELEYIGLGAYRDTSTKDVSNILGDKAEYMAKMSQHPVGLIGGVKINDEIPNISYNVIGSDLLK